MYEVKYWANKPVLAELLGTVDTIEDCHALILNHLEENDLDIGCVWEKYFIEEI